jgi:hypothetical protein
MNSSFRVFLALAAGAILSNALCANDGVAEKPVQESRSQTTSLVVPKYEIKSKSAFTLSPETRAPFWPIGWVKRTVPGGQIREKPTVTLNENAFVVTSILMGSPSLAVINGRAYSEGEFVRMPKDGTALRVRVQSINDGNITLQWEDQTLVVALRRPQLAERRPEAEAELLDPDR